MICMAANYCAADCVTLFGQERTCSFFLSTNIFVPGHVDQFVQVLS